MQQNSIGIRTPDAVGVDERGAQARRRRADREARRLPAPNRPPLLAERRGCRGRLPAIARDPADQSAQRPDERAGPVDPHRDQARGARGPAQAGATAGRRAAVGRGPVPRGLGGDDPGDRRRPRRVGRARRADRPQPRGAADAEAGGAAGADAARGGLLLRRDRRDHRLQPDQSQSLPGRGAGAVPQHRRPQRGRQPLRGTAPAPLRILRWRGERQGRHRRPRAPPRLRRLPGDDARLPGDRGGGGGSGAGAAPDRSLFDRLHDLPAAIQSRLPFGGGGGGDSAISQVAAAGGTRGRGNGGAGKTADDLRRRRRGRRRLRGRRRNPGAADRCPRDEGPHRRARLEDRVRGHRSRIRRTGAGAPTEPEPVADPKPAPERSEPDPEPEPSPSTPAPETSAGAVEYTPPPPPPPPPSSSGAESSSPSSGSAAGEFGP